MLSFKLTRSLRTQANHLGFTKPSNLITCYHDTNICLKQLLRIIIKYPNDCRQLIVLCHGVTLLKT